MKNKDMLKWFNRGTCIAALAIVANFAILIYYNFTTGVFHLLSTDKEEVLARGVTTEIMQIGFLWIAFSGYYALKRFLELNGAMEEIDEEESNNKKDDKTNPPSSLIPT